MEAPLRRSPRRLNLLGPVERAQGFRVTSEPETQGNEERRLKAQVWLEREKLTLSGQTSLAALRFRACRTLRARAVKRRSGLGAGTQWSLVVAGAGRWAKPNTRGDSGSVRRGFEACGARPPQAVEGRGGAGRGGAKHFLTVITSEGDCSRNIKKQACSL